MTRRAHVCQPRRTKIVATIGPASDSPGLLAKLLAAGVNATRQNFSHGTAEYHKALFKRIRRIAGESGAPVACLQDLQGPRIRTGPLKTGESLRLTRSMKVTVSGRARYTEGTTIAVNLPRLAGCVKKGHRVLIADGAMKLKALGRCPGGVACRVVRGGVLGERKGVNLPDSRLNLPGLTAKDRRDAALGAKLGFDYVALSFVREAAHVRRLRSLLRRLGSDAPIIAKIETPEAVDNLESILDEADGIMVARGDLAVETSAAAVPVLQKQIIRRTNLRGKLVITATEMLASMVDNATPTRAEASDVANAVFDHTDATMLSGETACGSHPVGAVRTMDAILAEAERFSAGPHVSQFLPDATFTHAAVHSACAAAEAVSARLIVVFTMSGATARVAAEARPACPIIALTPEARTYRKLALLWGVTPLMLPRARSADAMMKAAGAALVKADCARKGDTVVFVAGTSKVAGATNLVRIDKI